MGRMGYDWKKGVIAGSLGLLTALGLSTACTDGFDSLSPQGNLSLRLVAVNLDEQSGSKTLTRAGAAESVDENTIGHLWVLQFDGTGDGATLSGKSEYSGTELNPSDQTLKDLTVGKSQTLYFLANCDMAVVRDFAAGSTLTAFKQLSLQTVEEAALFPSGTYTPMIGYWTGEIKSNADGSSPVVATIQMERTVARIDLAVKTALRNGESFRVSSVRLYHVPDRMWLAGSATDPFPTTNFNLLDGYGNTTTVGNPPVSVRWYMPENRRGVGTAVVSTDKTAANLNAVSAGQGDKATYVEIVGDYTSGGNTYAAVYRNYLGGNSVTDYNIRRNSAYDITITIRGKNTSDSRVKVYGQAYTSVINPDEVNQNVNSVPVLDGVGPVRQTARDRAEATSSLTVDGEATARGFVYSETVGMESGLIWDADGVSQVREVATFTSGEYSAVLSGLKPATTYYIRSAATNSLGTAYGPITRFTTPSVRPAANCQMALPGETVLFEPKDATGNLKDIDAVSLAWQTREDGSTLGNLPVSKPADLIYDAAGQTILVHINPEVTAANVVLTGRKNGTAVWSWHIWVTPYRPDGAISGMNRNVQVSQGRIQTYDTKYVAAVGSGVAIMDRDLGSQAVSTLLTPEQIQADGSFHFGLLYQWGYALPCVPAQRHDGTKAIPVFDINGNETVPAGLQTTAALSDAWNINKTASDPCPSGWRVAPAGTFGDLVNYGVFPASNTQTDAGRLYIQGGVNAWFFANGVWTSGSVSAGQGTALTFTTSGDAKVNPAANVSALETLLVRCVQSN